MKLDPQLEVSLVNLLELHEGYSRFPYKDPSGNLTIGYGRNLTRNPLVTSEIEHITGSDSTNVIDWMYKNGVTHEQAEYLLYNDIDDVVNWVSNYSWFEQLSSNRKLCIIDLAYNVGEMGFDGFTKMLHDISIGDYVAAATEIKQSEWCGEVGRRCNDDMLLMLKG